MWSREIQTSPDNSQQLWMPDRRLVLATAAATPFALGELFNGEAEAADKDSEKMKALIKRVEKHIEASGVEWKSVRDVLALLREDCADGRGEKRMVGTLGGDMGNLVLDLTAVEQTTGQKVDLATVPKIFRAYREQHKGPFYLHSDETSFDNLARSFSTDKYGLKELLAKPGIHRARLLHALQDPANIGCGHVKHMLLRPRDYPGMRPELVKALLAEYFRELWEGEPSDYVVLKGLHKEFALLQLMSDEEEFTLDSEVPMIRPNTGESSIFVLHPQLEKMGDVEFTKRAESITGIKDIDHEKLLEKMATLRAEYLHASIKNLHVEDKPIIIGHYTDKDHPIIVAA